MAPSNAATHPAESHRFSPEEVRSWMRNIARQPDAPQKVFAMSATISRLVQALEPSATLAMAAKAKELKTAGKTVFDFSVGEPDFTTPEHICQAAVAAMKARHT